MVPLRAEDAERFLAVDLSAFFADPTGQTLAEATAEIDWERTFGATRVGDSSLCGVYTAYDMQLTAPGPSGSLRQLPMEGLSWVSVHPDHRRRGVLRAMMTHHLRRLHESGVALGGLHAAEVGIYGRFGYGVSSVEATLELGRGTTLTAPGLEDVARQVETRFEPVDTDAAAARVHDVHVRAAAATLGSVARPAGMNRAILRDVPAQRRGEEPRQVMFAALDGQTTGYAVFKRKHAWTDGVPGGTVAVDEVAATDPASLLALVRRMVDFDLTASASFNSRGLDDPITWWAGGPRSAKLKAFDSLWLRLVDLDAALTARGYAGPVDVVLDVVDEQCPWNHRRWRLTADESGRATCAATPDPADVRLPVGALAAAYLGARSLAGLSRHGIVEELRPEAVARLSRALRADTEPVGAIGF